MSTLKRIKEYIDSKDINIKRFEQSVGFSNGAFASQLKNNKTIGVDKLENILSVYSDINTEWLLTGKGTMLKTEKQYIDINPAGKLNENNGDYDNFRKIPMIDIEAAAGNGALNTDYIEVLGYLTVPSNALYSRTATYYAIRSRGDSMFPTIYDKDTLIVRVLDQGEWQDIRDEHVYVVVDAQGRTFVKRVKNRLQRGFVVLMSDNLDKGYYPNFTLEANELHFFLYPELRISPHLPNINATYFNRLRDLEDRFDDLSMQLKRIESK